MPDQYVKLPDGSYASFPADLPDDQIQAALAKIHAEAPTAPSTAASWLPTAGGVVGGIAGGLALGPPGAVIGATLGGAGGEGYRRTIEALRGHVSPSMSQDVRGMTEQGIKQGLMEGTGQIAGAAIGPLLETAGRSVMQSALKPAQKLAIKAIAKGQTIPVVDTLLQEGVNVTARGVEKLNAIISATNSEIDAAIQGAFGSVNPFKVTKPLSAVAADAAKQVNPVSDLEAISRVGQEFLDAHAGQALSVPEAQALKKGTYRSLGNKAYGELKGTEIEAQKALARGLKEEIAAEVAKSGVDITAANAREGAAITARDAVAKRVGTAGNRDLTGLAGLAISKPVTFLTVLFDRNPAVKSMLARGLYQSAGIATGLSPQIIRAAVAAVAGASDTQEPTP